MISIPGHAADVEVINTHFYSRGDEWPEEWRKSHRLAQAWEVAQLARSAADKGRHIFVVSTPTLSFFERVAD